MSSTADILHEAIARAMGEAAAGTARVAVPLGGTVLCDDCDEDYTGRPESGGLLFQSKAVGPCCAAKWEASAERYGEQRFIRGRCPEGESFAAWVLELRGGRDEITVSRLGGIA